MSKEKANEQISRQAGNNNIKSHTLLVVIISVVIVCILAGVIVYLLSQQGKEPEAKSYNNVITPENVDEVISQLENEERIPVGSYEVSMNIDWVFPDGDSVSTNAYVENSVSNQNTVYFTITLKDSDEEIYHSPYLMVGSRLADIKLDKALARGTYDAVITYHLVDDDFNDLSSVSMYMTITIEK